MLLRYACAGVLAAVFTLAAPAARAQSVDVRAGRDEFEQARFERAVSSFSRVLADPAASRADVVEAHRYLMTIRAAEGDQPGASAHANFALALDPSVTAPSGAPLAAAQTLDRIRALRTRGPMRVQLRFEARSTEQQPVPVAAEAVGAPAEASLRLRLRCRSNTVASVSVEQDSLAHALRFDVPPAPVGALLHCEASIVTAEGQILERATIEDRVRPRPPVAAAVPLAPAPSARIALTPAHQPARAPSAAVWGAIGVGAAALIVGAIVIGFVAGLPNDPYIDAPRFP